MNLEEQFPFLQRYQSPEWLSDVEASSEDDLLSEARASLARTLQDISGSAGLPLLLDLRLSGGSINDGSISSGQTAVIERFEQELQAVLPKGKKDLAKLEWAGISEGSTILHIKPRYPDALHEDELDIGWNSEFENALTHVLSVHEQLESGDLLRSLNNESKELQTALRRLMNFLVAEDVDFEVSMLSNHGARRVASITRRGRLNASQIFDREVTKERLVVEGYVYTSSLSGDLELRKTQKPRARKIEISKDPRAILNSHEFELGSFVKVRVEEVTTSFLAEMTDKTVRTFIEIVPIEEVPIEMDLFK